MLIHGIEIKVYKEIAWGHWKSMYQGLIIFEML